MANETKNSLYFKEVVYIEWTDAVAVADWETVEEASLFECKTFGFLVTENDKAICVAAVVSDSDKQSNAKIHIPKAWCDKIVRMPLYDVINESAVNPDIFKLSHGGTL
jgi:hypothetical protein